MDGDSEKPKPWVNSNSDIAFINWAVEKEKEREKELMRKHPANLSHEELAEINNRKGEQ